MNPHPFLSLEWYRWTHEEAQACHNVFLEWLRPRLGEIETVIEVGCGMHDFYPRLFADKDYIGLDNNVEVAAYKATQPVLGSGRHCYVTADIMAELDIGPADLVFSRAVIDHTDHPHWFLENCINASRRWVYVMNYRGYFAELDDHRWQRGADGIFYGDISVKAIDAQLAGLPVEYQIRCVETGRLTGHIQQETHIVVEEL
jgi:hypothetical protein